MKLLLRRDQKSGLIGKITFTLAVRAELTDTEKGNIKKYKLGDTVLYERMTMTEKGSGWKSLFITMVGDRDLETWWALKIYVLAPLADIGP